jgi:PAS domain S-box-containing protein
MQEKKSLSIDAAAILTEIPAMLFQLVKSGDQILFSYVNDTVLTELELKEKNVLDDFECFAKLISNVDQSGLLCSLNESFKNLTTWNWEGRFFLPSGKIKWIRGLGKPKWSIDGMFVLNGIFSDITDIRYTQEIFKSASQLSKTGAWEVDLINNTIYWSEEVYRIHEVDTKVKPDFANAIHYYTPESQIIIIDAIEKAVGNGTPYDLTLQMITAKNRPVWVRSIGQAVFENKKAVKLFGVFQEVTEQKHAEELIRRNEALLSETQELTHSGSWESDMITGKNYWSEEAFRIFGLEPNSEGPDNLTFGRMIHPEDRDLYLTEINKAIASSNSASFDLRIILPSGEVRYINAIGKPLIDENGKVTKLVGAIVDITHRKLVEEELVKAKEMAEQAAIAKSQFLSTMSHEIRTPMNAVLGFTNLLLQKDPTAEQLEYLKILKFSGDNLLVLINDILDFSKIEEGKIDFEKIIFDLKDLLDNIIDSLKHGADERGLTLQLHIEKNIPDFIVGDPTRLSQILTNLIANAIKFTDHGKISITVSLVSKDQTNTILNFKIVDTGIGIAPDQLDFIFDRFTRASSDATRIFEGTGLGLTITKKLIELQGGTIQVESELGKGSVFQFNLGFIHGNKQHQVTNHVSPDLLVQNLEGTKVLIAEDNEINVLLVRQFMKIWKVECDVVFNGLEVVKQIQLKDYDLILMDLQMPEMDGYQATRAIRDLPAEKFKKIPIIALTASAMLDVKEKVLLCGMNDYISKPFNTKELYNKIFFYKNKTN